MQRWKLIARDYAEKRYRFPDCKDGDQCDHPRGQFSGFVPTCVPDSMEDLGTKWPETQLYTPRVAKSSLRTN